MSLLKKLASETASYGITTILGRSLNFFLVFIHTKAFMPDELGVNISLYSYVAVASIIYVYGMETAFFRFATRADNQQYFNITLSAIVVSSLIFSGVLIAFSSPIISYLGFPGKESFLIWLAVIMATDAISAIPFARLRLEKKTTLFVKARLINIIINVALNIIFLLGFKGIAEGQYLPSLQPLAQSLYSPSIGAGYIFLANLIANLFFFVFLWKEFQNFQFEFDFAVFKKLFIYAYPIMFMSLASTFSLMFDRIMLERLLPENFYPGQSNQTALGIYGSAYKLSVFMALAVQSFKFAAEPFFFSQSADKNSPETFSKVMKYFIICCVLIWVFASLNLDLLGVIFLKKAIFWQGLSVVPLLLAANMFLGIYYNLSVWFKLSDRTYYGSIITFVGLGVTVLFNVLLIPLMGYMGCAIAFLISSFVMMAFCYLLGAKYYPIPYDVVSAAGYTVGGGALIWASSAIYIPNLWVAVPYHAVLCLLFLACTLYIERYVLIPARIRERFSFLR
jgi:O-antigen/teichoic acid export membrane protein